MKKQYGNSFILDTSIGMNNTIYLSPNTKKPITNSFSVKTDLYDQNLQCNVFLFLSIVHGNHQLNKLFIQRCGNKDKFLQMFDTFQYSALLTKVLQIINQYFTETQTQCFEQYPSSNNKSWYSSDQKYTPKQGSNDKFQSMIKKIITTDLDPLKSLINRVQEQNQSQQQSSTKITSSASNLSNKLSEKLMKTNILKDQLKEKITKLAMQNSYNYQYKLIKTETDASQTYSAHVKDTPSQTNTQQESILHKPNRISFGQQQLFNNSQNDDQIIEYQKNGKNQKTLIESSPTFLHHQQKDNVIQTSETQINLQNCNNQNEDQSNDNSLDLTPDKSRRFEGTFGKVKNRELKNKKKSNSVSGNVSPQRSDRHNHEVISIDQIQHKRKISINSVNRRYNILTNEQLE
ncbi:unnamed protein product [Paramecium sonneborni]|uniref:Uncharacterized protein n=1 Tax=Paramecium sonneborni TaxID=65129 RepID=A0A8S1R2I5_9CILI|nr:unnamed protein product [Paramecium sonneborni]